MDFESQLGKGWEPLTQRLCILIPFSRADHFVFFPWTQISHSPWITLALKTALTSAGGQQCSRSHFAGQNHPLFIPNLLQKGERCKAGIASPTAIEDSSTIGKSSFTALRHLKAVQRSLWKGQRSGLLCLVSDLLNQEVLVLVNEIHFVHSSIFRPIISHSLLVYHMNTSSKRGEGNNGLLGHKWYNWDWEHQPE